MNEGCKSAIEASDSDRLQNFLQLRFRVWETQPMAKTWWTRLGPLALTAALAACGSDDPMTDTDSAMPPTGCQSNRDCSDGVFCNGSEICDPEHPSADEDGCLQGATPCLDGQSCQETEAQCITGCDVGDADGDGHAAMNCGGDDCDDSDADRYPSNTEVCDVDHVDEDCNPTTFGDDGDGDGEVDAACCNLVGELRCGTDCNDELSSVNSGGTEVCNGMDEDCDGDVDEGVMMQQFADFDGDGFGNDRLTQERACDDSALWTTRGGDCDDSDATANPDAAELCDGIDNNCDANASDEIDVDRDGFLDPASQCEGGPLTKDDCNDLSATTFAGASEQCNDVDDDCDGIVDERSGATGADAYCNDQVPDGTSFCAVASDARHECIVAACEAGFADCDGSGANGCETDLQSDGLNCGGCGIRCTGSCSDGLCDGADHSPVAEVSLGERAGCFVRESGQLECWGEPHFIPLGNRPTPMFDDSMADTDGDGIVSDASLVAVADRRVFLTRTDGTLHVIGNPTTLPTPVMGVTGSVSALAAFGNVVCAVADGSVFCGDDGNFVAANIGSNAVSVAMGRGAREFGGNFWLCAVYDDGMTDCFSCNGGDYTCGPPPPLSSPPPIPTIPGAETARTIVLYNEADLLGGFAVRACLSTDENTYCSGELERSPLIRSEDERFTGASAGAGWVCGVGVDDQVLCLTREAECEDIGQPPGCVIDVGTLTLSPPELGGVYGAECNGELVDNACPGMCVFPDAVCGGNALDKHYTVRVPRSFSDGRESLIGYPDLTPVSRVAVSHGAACAVADGEVYCWGDSQNAAGLGVGPRGLPLSNPQRTSSLVAELAASSGHACARRADGTVACWGSNSYDQLGRDVDDLPADRGGIVLVPQSVRATSTADLLVAKHVATAQGSTCVVLDGGTVQCWGDPSLSLGATTIGERFEVPFDMALGEVTELSVARWHGCALHEEGRVSCWGSNFDGESGPGAASTTPVEVVLPAPASEVVVDGESVGDDALACAYDPYSCALLVDGRVACWGSGRIGNLGQGNLDSTGTPVIVPGVDSAVDIDAGFGQVCVVETNGRVKCWGADLALVGATGELCDGPTQVTGCFQGPPIACATRAYVVPNIDSAVAVQAGAATTCAVLRSGDVTCWGLNERGQAGDGTTLDRRVPGTIAALPSRVRALSFGGRVGCALVVTGEVLCWGPEDFGERGDGADALNESLLPRLVPGL